MMQFPIFSRNGEIVITSFKVMSSHFRDNPDFQRTYWNRKSLPAALSNRFLGNPRSHFVFRDPVSRFLSYFKDKFRQEPARMLAEDRLKPENLQACQRYWLESTDVDVSNVPDACEALLSASIGDVINWLPENYTRDGHTMPQLMSLYFDWRGLNFRLKPVAVYLQDDPEDVAQLAADLKFKIAEKANSTSRYNASVSVTDAERDKIKAIYAADMHLFENSLDVALFERPKHIQAAVQQLEISTR
ncbi:MAG: hypothetical protein AAF768_06555 [Pseudomonadota bacterium]